MQVTNEDKATAEHFKAMDHFLTDPDNIRPRLSLIQGSWHMEWADTPFEQPVKDLFGATALPTAWTWQTNIDVVVYNIRSGAEKRIAKHG